MVRFIHEKKFRAKITNEYIILPHSFPDPEKLKDQLSKNRNIYGKNRKR